jgi:hypothetical protein
LRVDASTDEIPERNKLNNVAGCHSAVGRCQANCVTVL